MLGTYDLGWLFSFGIGFLKLSLTISKVTQLSKAADTDNLSGHFLKNGPKFLSKPITDLCNHSINS